MGDQHPQSAIAHLGYTYLGSVKYTDISFSLYACICKEYDIQLRAKQTAFLVKNTINKVYLGVHTLS